MPLLNSLNGFSYNLFIDFYFFFDFSGLIFSDRYNKEEYKEVLQKNGGKGYANIYKNIYRNIDFNKTIVLIIRVSCSSLMLL